MGTGDTGPPDRGMHQDFVTAYGQRVSVVMRDSGERDLLLFERDAPGARTTTLRLAEGDAHRLADALRRLPAADEAAPIRQVVGAVSIETLRVKRSFAAEGFPLGAVGGDGGATIVAIVRGTETLAAPSRDVVLHDGDVVVAVGTDDAIRRLFGRVRDG